jgi:hypothetical protein
MATGQGRGTSWWLLALAATLPGCEGKTASSVGEYEIEATSVAAGITVPDASVQGECGPLYPPGVVGKNKYRVTRKADAVSVLDVSGGCTMDARIERGVVVADGSDCTLSEGGALRQFGVLSATYQVFRLDPKLHTHLAKWSALQQTTGGLLRSCNVLEGYITGYTPESGSVAEPGAGKPTVLRYDASYSRTPDQADAAASCDGANFHGQASGFVVFDSAQLSLRFEALNCALKLQKDEQGVFRLSDNQPCQSEGRIGFVDLGINTLSFDNVALDLTANTLQASGRAVRNSHDGEKAFCIELDGKVAPAQGL